MEHVNLINRIIEAEQKAQQIADEAREKLVALPEELKTQKQKLKKDLFDRADRRIRAVRERENEMTEERVAQLDARLQNDMAALEDLFDRHREEWVETLFTMVTGR